MKHSVHLGKNTKSTAELESALAIANEYARLLEHRLETVQKRLDHSDIELAQARVSREKWHGRFLSVLNAAQELGLNIEWQRTEDTARKT